MRVIEVHLSFLHDQISQIRPIIKAFLEPFDHEGLHLEIGINEALNNAFYHSPKQGYLQMQLCLYRNHTLIIRIHDNGLGFQVGEKLATYDFNTDNEGGRGLLLMQAYFDRMIYNHNGNEVLLAKKMKGMSL